MAAAEIPFTTRSGSFASAASSLMIVPTPWPWLIAAPLVAPDRPTPNVSFGSTLVSPLIVTETVLLFSLAPKCRLPEVAA